MDRLPRAEEWSDRRSPPGGLQGFEGGYAAGDFEAPDLCLRMRGIGKRVLCDQRVDLRGVGVRTRPRGHDGLARYGSLRHERRWGSIIQEILRAEAGVR